VSATLQSPRVEPVQAGHTALRFDRICLGLLAVLIGAGWIVDNAGGSVPWRLFPSLALALVGVALLASVRSGRGHGELISLGAVLLVAALVTGVAAGRFSGPVGDRTVAPAVADWPVETHLSAGKITVDLSRHPLPASGHLQVSVGAGDIVVLVPTEARIRIDARVAAGRITVSGRPAQSGLDLHWTDQDPPGDAVQLDLRVAFGSIGVDDA
jgi:hypothetical protein